MLQDDDLASLEFNRRGGQRWANANFLGSATSIAGGTFSFLTSIHGRVLAAV
jgi:hypothetical protein